MSEAREQRRLAAIVSTDVVGYSRLMGLDERGTLAALRAHRAELIDPAIAANGGRIVKTLGDGLLLEFPSVVDATRCAIEVQTAMAERNVGVPEDKRIVLRIGINLGDVIIEGDDIYGDGVNIAARLQEIADPGGLTISRRVHEDVRDRLDAVFADGGERALKNIARPVQVWSWHVPAPGTVRPEVPGQRPSLALPDKPSVAVLPFTNMSRDPEQEYFADGITENIITELSRFRSLFVIARNSSFTYKGKAVDVRTVARELGVRYVLEGSVQKAGNRVRITGQLIQADSGSHIWAERYDGDLADIFALQDKVTADVVGAIAPRLEQAEIERSRRKPTESLGAFDLYLRGLACAYHPSAESSDQARKYAAQAIALDPDFAGAHALIAYANGYRKGNGLGLSRHETEETGRLARRAVELDRDDAVVLTMAAWSLAQVSHDVDTAAGFVERALALNPNLAQARFVAGWINVWLGNPDDALEHFGHAMRSNPLDPNLFPSLLGVTHAHFMSARYEEAFAWAGKVLRERRRSPSLRIAAASAGLAGRLDEGQKLVDEMLQVDPTRRVSNLEEVLGSYKRAEDVARYKEGLRRAGLRE